MTDVFVERTFEPPLTEEDVRAMVALGADCLDLHRVAWQGSLLSTDGHRLLCRFDAGDADSVRAAFRGVGAGFGALWAGTVHDAPAPDGANVVVERSFAAPVALDDVQAIEDAHAVCLESHQVTFCRTLFSRDCRRMICLYRAPDAESVRAAQRDAGMPFERVWPFRPVRPAAAAGGR